MSNSGANQAGRMAGDPRVLGLLENQKANNMAINALGNTFDNYQGTNMPIQGSTPDFGAFAAGTLKVDQEGIYGAKGSVQVPINKQKNINASGGLDVNFPFSGQGQDQFGTFNYDNPGSVNAQVGIGRQAPKGFNWNLGVDYKQDGRHGGGFGGQAGFSNTF